MSLSSHVSNDLEDLGGDVLKIPEVDPYLVLMTPEVNPKDFSLLKKWTAIIIVATGAACATCASSMPSFIEPAIMQQFHVSQTVAILGISLFVMGLGCGPLIVGPFSEVLGRNLIFQVSFVAFWLSNWPLAFAPDIVVYLVFRFISGFCGSAFLSVAGGTVSDLFKNEEVPAPMAVYSLGPFAGPVLGPLMAGFIAQHLSWRWVFRLLLIWSFVQLLVLIFIMPETYEPFLLQRMAQKKRKDTGDDRYYAPLERENRSLSRALLVSCYKPFQILLFDRMALLLDLWNSLILGILYLAFQAFPIIFGVVHSFNVQSTGMSFLGIGLGMFIATACAPLTKRITLHYIKKHKGPPPPEVILKTGQIGAICIPVGLFWIAFTTYHSVHWIVPIIGSILFGAGVVFSFSSTFSYLVVAYRPIAASALASNSFMRSSFAAGFPLFADAMYRRLGTVGATALLAGLSTLMAPLPFVFDRYGAQIRQSSRFAVK